MRPSTPPSPAEEPDALKPVTPAPSPSPPDEQGRVYPCEGCGADLRYDIGASSLSCEHCGRTVTIELEEDARIEERDYAATLARVRKLREDREAEEPRHEVTCGDCGATVEFVGTLVSTACAFCGQPVQIDQVRQAEWSLPVDAVLPFQQQREEARRRLDRWVRTRWFAPSSFRRAGVSGRLGGVYLPFWTFDSLTFNRYRGQRGDHYTVTVRRGKQTHRERRTRWSSASGRFQRFFDDVLIVGGESLSAPLLRSLEPWPLSKCEPYDPQFLVGFLARRPSVDLDAGFVAARERMAESIDREVRQRIGGDVQRVDSIQTRHDAITFKHLLLPVWSLGYRHREKHYQVVINAATGEVRGTRPWSAVKITLTVLLVLVIGILVALATRG